MEVIKIVKSREYYKQQDALLKEAEKKIDYHVRQAQAYKQICMLTKDRKGLYKLLSKLAYRMNQVHVKKGTQLATENMKLCLVEIAWLTNYVNNLQKSEEP